ncbi:hypothetical protein ES703_44809 [subsurface metagenome]
MIKIIAIVIIIMFLSGIFYPIEAQGVRKPKSETTALYWSIGATAIPCAVSWLMRKTGERNEHIPLIIGVAIGPSTGHFYANQGWQAIKGISIRSGIGALGVLTTIIAAYGDGKAPAIIIGCITGATVIGSAVYDIFTAPSSVRKYNKSIDKTGNVYFIPKVDIKEESYGLSVVYCF